MDFDTGRVVNLDRLVGGHALDVVRAGRKVDVAQRLMTHGRDRRQTLSIVSLDLSVCEPEGLAAALDYDVIVSCVDRPWARAVLNRSPTPTSSR